MKNNNQGLQKSTLSEVLKLEIITKDDFFKLNENDQNELLQLANKHSHGLKGDSRDKHYKKYWELISKETRCSLWESNHVKIINSIHTDLIDFGNIPAVTRLQELTGLSRKTIHKHLKEYKQSEYYQNVKDEFQILHSQVLKVVYRMAMKEDIRACKLLLEVTGDINKTNVSTYIDKQQNNSTPIVVQIVPPKNDEI